MGRHAGRRSRNSIQISDGKLGKARPRVQLQPGPFADPRPSVRLQPRRRGSAKSVLELSEYTYEYDSGRSRSPEQRGQPGQVFHVQIDRRGERLGIDINRGDLSVSRITTGAVQRHNQDQPQRICIGDRFLAVNGRTLSTFDELQAAVASEPTMRATMRRPVHARMARSRRALGTGGPETSCASPGRARRAREESPMPPPPGNFEPPPPGNFASLFPGLPGIVPGTAPAPGPILIAVPPWPTSKPDGAEVGSGWGEPVHKAEERSSSSHSESSHEDPAQGEAIHKIPRTIKEELRQ